MDINEEQLRILNNILNIFEIEKFDPAKGHIERVSMQGDLFIFSGIDVSDKDVRKLVVNYDFLDDKGSLLEKRRKVDNHKNVIVEDTIVFNRQGETLVGVQKYLKEVRSLNNRQRVMHIDHEGLFEKPITKKMENSFQKVYKK